MEESGPKGVKKGVLFIHGPAGSGKTTVVDKIKAVMVDDVHEAFEKQGLTLVPIIANLPLLQNPVSDLVHEAKP